ncbi:MAG: cation diffusion facilitator family transporter [Spirochaetia bacterium]|nr:cation diffusion facilitator family transporter [Spirochaetia bacterium]
MKNEEINKLNKKAGIASIITAIFLFTTKLFIAIAAGSASILGSALDSGLDFISSLINLFAILTAQKPADLKHRFGYGKAEALAGFIQSIIIFLSGLYLVYYSILKIKYENPVNNIEEGLFVMILSLIMTILLVYYQTKTLKKTQSIVLSADRLHYLTDVLTNLLVIISLMVQKWFTIYWIDSAAGLFLAFYVMKSSSDIFKSSFFILMDRDISQKYRKILIELIETYKPKIVGYHDLRSRTSGGVDFLEFHLEMPKDISLEESHHLVENFMITLKKRFPMLEMIIHADPAEIAKDGTVERLLDKEKPRFY